jgi:uncharacterized membrane protein YeaQ/YmgE (transglycosylase-associated protein family)
MTLASVTTINIIPNSGILDTIFHKTWLAINIFGLPSNCTPQNSMGCGGYALTLIGLIIIVIIAVAAAGITERLAGAKPGGLLAAVLITLLGAWLFSAYVLLPFEIVLEGVRLVAAFVGAVVVAVFYVLLRNQFKGSGGKK